MDVMKSPEVHVGSVETNFRFTFTLESLLRAFIVVREEFKRLYWLGRFGSGGRFSKALLFWSSRFIDRQLIEHIFFLSLSHTVLSVVV